MNTKNVTPLKRISLLFVMAFLLSHMPSFNVAFGQSLPKDKPITERRFQRLIKKKNVALIDVRTLEEYTAGHIPDAMLLDVQQEGFADSIQKLDKGKIYLLYCRSGKRSQKAIQLFRENGFAKVYHLKGGYSQWEGKKVN